MPAPVGSTSSGATARGTRRSAVPLPPGSVAALIQLLPADEVALIDATGGSPVLAAASGEGAEDLAGLELESGAGPGLEALAGDAPVVAVLTSRARWPALRRPAAAVGFRWVMGHPVRLDGATLGALVLWYRHEPPSARVDERVPELAVVVAQLLAEHRAVAQLREEADGLQQALDRRTVIEQAKGMLAQAAGTDPSEAFEHLRRYARDHRVRVSEVAVDVVGRRLGPGELVRASPDQPVPGEQVPPGPERGTGTEGGRP